MVVRLAHRGIALVTALLMVLVVLVMIVAVVSTVRSQSYTTIGYHREVQAHYAAEAGLTATLQALRNRSWSQTLEQTLLDGEASFRVEFAAVAPVGPLQSVNNLLGQAAVSGPRGPDTVPPGSAHLIIVGRSGRAQVELEAVVRNGSFPDTELALLADGSVEFQDEVRVEGIDSLSEGQPVEAGVHSNLNQAGEASVSWNGTGVARFEGTVSSSGSLQSLKLNGAQLLGTPALEGDGAPRPFPYIDVEAEVTGKSGAGTVSVPASGDLVLGTGTPADFYRQGDTVIEGDLILDGATLYVDGDLHVTGTIHGDGGVYVHGDATFLGGAEVTTNNQRKAAVYSSGDLELRGYNGTDFIESKTQDPVLQDLWNRTKTALGELQTELDAGNLNQVDRLRASLGEEYFPGSNPGPLFSPPVGSAWSPHGHDLFRHLANHLENNYPAEPRRDFLIERFHELEYFFHNSDIDVDRQLYPLASHGWPLPVTLDDWRDRTGHPGGPFDAILDRANPSHPNYTPIAVPELLELSNVVDRMDVERLGSAFFQGIVYSGGRLTVEHELHVVGAILVQRADGEGRARLGNATELTFVREYFDPTVPTTVGGPPQLVSRWVR